MPGVMYYQVDILQTSTMGLKEYIVISSASMHGERRSGDDPFERKVSQQLHAKSKAPCTLSLMMFSHLALSVQSVLCSRFGIFSACASVTPMGCLLTPTNI